MSMLAEPRRRLKWSLNPRGNLWANDENKFGQKLLEKMGWKKGNGLGKSENGRTEHVRVNYKNDNNGIGWSDNSNGWMAHQDEFNSILASLNSHEKSSKGSHSKEPVVQNIAAPISLEQRSKSFKSRVHYQKFIRGKDVSRYSKEDMKCIFGGKLAFESEIESKQETEEGKSDNPEENNMNDSVNYSNYNGVSTYKNISSIADYFAEKMKSKLKAKNISDDKTANSADSSKDIDSVSNVSFVKKKKKRSHSEMSNEEHDTSVPEKRHCGENDKFVKDMFTLNGLKEEPKEEKCSFSNVTKLKSCLKKVNVTNGLKMLVKQVSFNKKLVSYEDSDDEADVEMPEEEQKCEEKEMTNTEGTFGDRVPYENLFHESDNSLSSKEIGTSDDCSSLNKSDLSDSSCTERRLSNDDSWAVSQKMAAKMNYYKSILKNIKKHKILSTTNLLDIKGYGN